MMSKRTLQVLVKVVLIMMIMIIIIIITTIIIIIAIMSIASYLAGKGEHTALYKININVYINTWGKNTII